MICHATLIHLTWCWLHSRPHHTQSDHVKAPLLVEGQARRDALPIKEFDFASLSGWLEYAWISKMISLFWLSWNKQGEMEHLSTSHFECHSMHFMPSLKEVQGLWIEWVVSCELVRLWQPWALLSETEYKQALGSNHFQGLQVEIEYMNMIEYRQLYKESFSWHEAICNDVQLSCPSIRRWLHEICELGHNYRQSGRCQDPRRSGLLWLTC